MSSKPITDFDLLDFNTEIFEKVVDASPQKVQWGRSGKTIAWISIVIGTLGLTVGLTSLLFQQHILQFDVKALNWVGSLSNNTVNSLCIGGLTLDILIVTYLFLAHSHNKFHQKKEFIEVRNMDSLWEGKPSEDESSLYSNDLLGADYSFDKNNDFKRWRKSAHLVKNIPNYMDQ